MFTNRHFLKHNETHFDAVCRLARAKDVRGLELLQDSNLLVDVYKGSVTPVEQLAAEGDVEAVNLLIQKFGVLESLAATGYAKTNNRDAIVRTQYKRWNITGFAIQHNMAALREMMSTHSGRAGYGFAIGRHSDTLEALEFHAPGEKERNEMVIRGYALEGHKDLLLQWMPWVFDWANHRRACLIVIEHFAMGGHHALVDEMIFAASELTKELHIKKAASGYINGAHFDRAEEMMMRSNDETGMINCIIEQYENNNYLRNPKAVLCVMTFTNSLALRTTIANRFVAEEMRQQFLTEASRTNRIMHQYKVGYGAAQALQAKGTYFWLLKGLELVADARMVPSIFNQITSHVLDCSADDVNRIATQANKSIYYNATSLLLAKYHDRLFTEVQLADDHKKISDNFIRQKRSLGKNG